MREQQPTQPSPAIVAELLRRGLPSNIQIPVTLYPSRWQAALLLAVCSLFVFIGIATFRDDELMGYLAIGFFGLGMAVFALQFHRKALYLHLASDAFTFCNLFRACTVRWEHVLQFGVTFLGSELVVAWNFTPDYPASKRARDLARTCSGYEALLPDTYGVKAQELAHWMECLRRRYARQAATDNPEQDSP